MKLALDHHYATAIAVDLRAGGFDVVAAVERGWHDQEDEALLALCLADDRALLTNNVGDFAVIVRRWAATGRAHAGVVFTSDATLPRSRKTIGVYVDAIDRLLRAHEAGMMDVVAWLARTDST